MKKRSFNFSSGPAVLPLEVLERAQKELLNYDGSGMSVMEMSHRSKTFEAILARAEALLRKLLNISDKYAVLFLQGGASLQFSMVPINLYLQGKPVDMVMTGAWSEKALTELKRVGEHHIVGTSKEANYTYIPTVERFNPDASYAYITSNNTIFGSQWADFPVTGNVPLVADMSSDILSRPLDVNQFGLIFAGAQKNLGPAGVTIVIIRKDLAERCPENVATMLQYRTHIQNGSMYNTPPTFPIYMVQLVLEWIEQNGGLEKMAAHNAKKAALLYDAIDTSSYYYCPVQKGSRSNMNVVFRVIGNKEDLEKKFAAEATAAGLTELKGHRSVGGLRASLYNAQSMEAVEALVEFMKEFRKKN